MKIQTLQPGRTFMGRLPYDADLLATLTEFCVSNNISLGELNAIGAVKQSRVGFYSQSTREYSFLEFNEPMEIISLTGNVSIKDEKPFVHAHIALMDEKGNLYGGHLADGTIIFAFEFVIKEFIASDNAAFKRALDDQTGLYLWPVVAI